MSTRLKELKWRTFDDLMNEVNIDMYSFSQDSSIQPAQLIKMVQLCNKELGVKIQKTKETVLDVCDKAAKLPADFDLANFALVAHHWKRHECTDPGYLTGYSVTERSIYPDPTLTTCPCWTVVSTGAQTTVKQCDGTEESVFFPANDDSSAKTTKVCAMSITPHANLVLTEGSGCFYDYATTSYSCTKPVVCKVCERAQRSCGGINPDPWHQSSCYTVCDTQKDCITAIHTTGSVIREYSGFEQFYFLPSREASAFNINSQFRNCRYQGQIKNGFIYMNMDCSKLYLNYQGTLEDEEGNLLLIDHPILNEYYEYTIKARILENLFINGEPDLERRFQYIKKEAYDARLKALSLVNMPEVSEMINAYKTFRSVADYKYFSPLNKAYSNTPSIYTLNSYTIE
jgi:hypothetical protein